MTNNKKNRNVLVLLISIFCVIFIFSLSYGESSIGFVNSIKALVGKGDETNIIIVQNIRLPRTIAACVAGATLGVSGFMTRIALQNPLADSSILGIQSGASVFALFAILVLPSMISFLPLFAFLGGLQAFTLVIGFAYQNGLQPTRLILSGVAINSFFVAITNIITINHVNELQNSIQWTSGSLIGISLSESFIMVGYALCTLVIAFMCIPILELLKLDETMLVSLGKNPNTYRIIVCVVAIVLASISLAYVGIITFVGIIAPHMSQLLIRNNLKYLFITTMIMGAILVVGVDLFSKIVFENEIPVGALIGVLGAPLFLYLLRRTQNGI